MQHHIRIPSNEMSLQKRSRARRQRRFQRRVSTRGGISTRSRTEKLYLPFMLLSANTCCTRNLSSVPAHDGSMQLSGGVCSSYLDRDPLTTLTTASSASSSTQAHAMETLSIGLQEMTVTQVPATHTVTVHTPLVHPARCRCGCVCRRMACAATGRWTC